MLHVAPVGPVATPRWHPAQGIEGGARTASRADLRRMMDLLTTESAAFLSGTYAETLAARAEAVPGWAWTNLLAHGSDEDLRRQAAALDRGLLRARAWLAARGYLAAEIIDRVDRGTPLVALQREVLVPFELGLMERARRQPCDGLSVVQWVVEARAALVAHDTVAAHSGAAHSA